MLNQKKHEILYIRRMHDYMRYILLQFSQTQINFQRIRLVDTSNPFTVRSVPKLDQNIVQIHFLDPPTPTEYKLELKGLIEGASITGFNTLVVPGGKMMFAIELVLTRRIQQLLQDRS